MYVGNNDNNNNNKYEVEFNAFVLQAKFEDA